MAEKQRWELRRGVPLTRIQWTVVATALLVAVVGMPVLIVLGKDS